MSEFPSPTHTNHTTPYAAIDPKNPELSQHGKNVVITGAGSGIGRALAQSFANAGASNIALIGRTPSTLIETENIIHQIHPNVKTHIYAADITDEASIDKVFAACEVDMGGPLHVLLANAAKPTKALPLTAFSARELETDLMTNAIGTHICIKAFLRHVPSEDNVDGAGFRAKVIHTSTAATALRMAYNGPYMVSKTAGLRIVEAYAEENPNVWFTSFHPGLIETALSAPAKEMGIELVFDDVTLPANWAVWAASSESTLIPSGRFLSAHWDVDELSNLFVDAAAQGTAMMGGFLHFGTKFALGITGWA